MLGTILVILLILFLIGALPSWGYHNYGYGPSGGLGLVTTSAPVHERAAIISAAYVVGYLLQALAALGLGAIATASGLQAALDLGAPLILLLGVAALVVANLPRRREAVTA